MTGILKQLSVLVTSRYHASVLSMERGIPIAAISMDERLDGIMRDYQRKLEEMGRFLKAFLNDGRL